MKPYLYFVFLWAALPVFMLKAEETTTPADVDARVDKLMGQLTLAEKMSLVAGDPALTSSTVGIDRLGIPKLLMSDGQVHRPARWCVFPSMIALSATWDCDLAGQNGTACGLEDRANGIHIHLYPGVNISRTPTCGRNWEYFGEDPFLAGKMVAPYIRGIEAEGVVATIKHFACNNQESDRMNVSAEVDERTLQEIYLPAFRYAVQEGNVSALMCAYNRVNGVFCSENTYLLQDVLRDQWGFKGLAMSDWGAVHSIKGLGHGLDLEMPTGAHYSPQAIAAALQDKSLTMDQLDECVRRFLRLVVAKGFMDRPQKRADLPLDSPASDQVALQVAREAIVLLKNQDNVLPLQRSAIHKIAVFGRNALQTRILGGGSGSFGAFHTVNFLDGIRKAAGKDIDVSYTPPAPQDADYSTFPLCEVSNNGPPGLVETVKIVGSPEVQLPPQTIQNIDFKRTSPTEPFLGIPADHAGTVTFSGVLVAPEDSDWKITYEGLRCVIRDQNRGDTGPNDFLLNGTLLHLKKNVPLPIEFSDWVRPGNLVALRATISKVPVPDVSLARDADVAIVCVARQENEGSESTFELPADDVSLIAAVCAANPHTIVVNQSGSAVEMASWISQPAAVLQSWFIGQEGGTALGEVLFGDINPSGHLPVTFERRLEDYPAVAGGPATYLGTMQPGVGYPKVNYSEGIFVGYRGTDKAGRDPLFPFGYGLSYTTFTYKNMSVHTIQGGTDPKVSVQFDVENSGPVAGAEVSQLYVGDTHSSVPRPVRELKGFNRVMLAPGETKTVTIALDKSSFAFYDVVTKSWKIEPGDFQISVGSSSRDLPLKGSVTL